MLWIKLQLLNIVFIFYNFVNGNNQLLKVEPNKIDVAVHEKIKIKYTYSGKDEIFFNLKVFNKTSNPILIEPTQLFLSSKKNVTEVQISSSVLTSRLIIIVENCLTILPNKTSQKCPFDKIVSFLIIFFGVAYFFAWSISFYPQIFLNYQRKSVIGLNFDFLFLNTIGFICYAIFNIEMYFDKNVQDIYLSQKPFSQIPVLVNDVVFATHALVACLVTGVQCFIYEREDQKISQKCWFLSFFFIEFATISFLLAIFQEINWLKFITFLSYIKMAVTLSKYFPQAFFNCQRKSTVGWSIGNIFLDFFGGIMSILQMILQAYNTDDLTIFSGNVVKVGLGFISIAFDIFFIIQHYYFTSFKKNQTSYDQVETTTNSNTANLDEQIS